MIASIAVGLFGFVSGLVLAQVGAVDVDPTVAGGAAGVLSMHVHQLIQTAQLKRHADRELAAHVRAFHPPAWVIEGERLERLQRERELTPEEAERLESIKMQALGAMRAEPYAKESAERLRAEQAAEVAAAARDAFGWLKFLRDLFSVRR